MPNLDEAWVRDRLGGLIADDDTITLDESDANGGTIRVSVPASAVATMFAGVDAAGTAEQVRDALHAVNQAWVDAQGNPVAEGTPGAEWRDLGYGGYIDAWHAAGLLD